MMELLKIASILCSGLLSPESDTAWNGEAVTGESPHAQCVAKAMADPKTAERGEEAEKMLAEWKQEIKRAQADALRELLKE